MCEKMKSANPRSGEMPKKCILFCGFACSLRLTVGQMRRVGTVVGRVRLGTRLHPKHG